MEPKQTNQGHPRRETEKDERQDGEVKSPTEGIPPLPEPDVEGVGEESGPSAGEDSDTLRPDQKKMAEDGTGF